MDAKDKRCAPTAIITLLNEVLDIDISANPPLFVKSVGTAAEVVLVGTIKRPAKVVP